MKHVAWVVIVVAFGSVAYVAVQDAGVISVEYGKSLHPDHQRLRTTLSENQWLEYVAVALDEAFLIPRDLRIGLVECSQPNAFYDPAQAAIILCYELITTLVRTYQPFVASEADLTAVVLQTTYFVLYHEVGHALIDLLNLPVTGREEDAVDQLATLVLLEAGVSGREAALRGANWFALNAQRSGGRTVFWDEHSLDQQRYFNVLCWVYGSNPTEQAALLATGWGLPQQRAARCPGEYARMFGAWEAILAEYRH